MDLYLIRHAEAVPQGTAGFDDWSRPLTDIGHDQTRRLGALFRRPEFRLDAVVTSPLLRARQTADGFVAQLSEARPVIQVFDEIGDAMRPKRVAEYLETLGKPAVAIVGHQPTLGEFVAWLLGSKKAHIDLDKAGVAYVVCDSVAKGGGALRWLVTPEWFPPSDGAKS